MKKRYLLTIVAAILGVLLLTLVARGQGTVDADWHTVEGGGGVSTGSIFTVRGTAGQPDASVSSGLIYTVRGGFWGGAAAGDPTAVTLASFSAAWSGDAVLVTWETTMEIDTVGFNVWRSTAADGAYTQVNETLIPAASPGGVWGGAYSHIDSDVIPGVTYYKLEELEVGGGRNWYGPTSMAGNGPTAVTLQALSTRGAPGLLLLAALITTSGLVAAHWIRRRRAEAG